MINFIKIRYKNILSTGNSWTELSFIDAKTTLVLGKNGGGKSTLIDALHFALFGKPFRNINKPQLLNTINRKDMVVDLDFSIGKYAYKIVRGMKPNIFEVYQDGILINQNAEIKEYQEVLEQNILKMTPRTFEQIVVLGGKYVSFMNLPAAQRRELIESLLDVQMFSVMNNLLKERVSNNKASIQDAQYKRSQLNSQIELLQNHLNALNKSREDIVEQKTIILTEQRDKQQSLTVKLHNLQDEIKKVQVLITDIESVDAKEKLLRQTAVKVETKLERLSKEIEFYSSNDSCPTCKQGIAHDHKTKTVETNNTKIQELIDGTKELQKSLDKVYIRQQEIRKCTNHIIDLQRQESNIKTEIKLVGENIKVIEAEIKKISMNNSDIETVTLNIVIKRKELDLVIAQHEKCLGEKQVMDVASVLLKDTGIKTKIIRQYIPVINKMINKYLSDMDFFVNFELNDSFEETIKSRYRDEFTFGSFSEGEKARIDFAILFTWRAIAKMRNSSATNLLILDEVFGNSLETSAYEALLNIIDDISSTTNTIMISHSQDLIYGMADRFERTLTFEKRNNFSEMTIQ